VTARSEPLLWLQLLGLGAMPLELLLVLLLLAGSDPGPFPGLERVLVWALGAVAPSVLLWRMPPDPLSLLLLCTPARLRTPGQLGFSQQPMGLTLKLLLASGAALLLPLLWWLDTTSVLATSYALLPTPNRLVALVAVTPLLTLMVWQWQQLVQATVLLGRNQQPTDPSPGPGNPAAEAHPQPLCLGLPWLRLPALDLPTTPALLQAPGEPREAQVEETAEAVQVPGGEPESPPDDQTAALAPVLDGAGEVAAEPELMDDLASELPATEPEEQDSVEVAPEDHEDTKDPEDDSLASPLGIENGDPEITDVEFTPLDSIELESAAVAIEPQEAAKEAESTDLDPQIG